jgi:photosystem II stability/assembly factor-like uncharacterized protein
VLYARIGSGAGWLNHGMPFEVPEVGVNPRDPRHVVAMADDGVWTTKDSGNTWTPAISKYFHGRALTFHPARSDTVYSLDGDFHALVKSTDGGSTFRETGSFVRAYGVRRMLVDPYNAETFYFVAGPSGIYKLTREGENAFASNDGLPRPRNILDMTPLRVRDGYLAMTRSTIYRTRNGAGYWEEFAGTPETVREPIKLFAVDEKGQHIYLLDKRHLWETANGGRTWRNIAEALTQDPQMTFSDVTDPRNPPIFLATRRGVFRLENP